MIRENDCLEDSHVSVSRLTKAPENITQWAHGTITPEQFKIQKQNILEWFSEYTEMQRNIIIKELLDVCHRPQLHLISTRFQSSLHSHCHHNCQDLITCLPQPICLKIFHYLDPVSLCQASQACRIWYNIAHDATLWQGLSRLSKYSLGDEFRAKLIHEHTTLPSSGSSGSKPKVKWKEVFAEQYRIACNWLTGRCLVKTFEGHTMGVSCVQFDDVRIVSGSYDATIKVWNIKTNLPWSAQTLTGHSDTIRCLVLSGNRLISGSSDSTIKVWDLNTDRGWSSIACKMTMVSHSDTVRCLHVKGLQPTRAKEKDDLLISGSYDQTLRLWNMTTGACLNTLEGHLGHVLCVQANHGAIVSGSSDKTIKIWNMDGECLNTLVGHTDSVTCLQMDREKIMSGSLDYTIKFWSVRSGDCIRSIDWMAAEGHTSAVRCIHADEFRLISGSDDRTIKVWDQLTGERLVTLQNHTDGVTCLQSNATHIVSGSYDKRVLLWDFSI